MRRLLDWTAFHLVFTALTAVLAVSGVVTLPDALLVGVVTYNISLPVFAHERDEDEAVRIWAFLLPLSAMMVVPDWFLCSVLDTLVFPAATGNFAVPSYMAGLWTVALFGPVWVGVEFHRRHGPRYGATAAVVLGGLFFVGGEMALTAIPVWRAVDVTSVAGAALYILPAELLLSFGAWLGYLATQSRNLFARLGAGAGLTFAYLGAACTSYLVLERVVLG